MDGYWIFYGKKSLSSTVNYNLIQSSSTSTFSWLPKLLNWDENFPDPQFWVCLENEKLLKMVSNLNHRALNSSITYEGNERCFWKVIQKEFEEAKYVSTLKWSFRYILILFLFIFCWSSFYPSPHLLIHFSSDEDSVRESENVKINLVKFPHNFHMLFYEKEISNFKCDFAFHLSKRVVCAYILSLGRCKLEIVQIFLFVYNEQIYERENCEKNLAQML